MTGPAIDLADWVRGLIAELDPKLTATSDGYSEGSILFASYVAGASEAIIAYELAYDREFVDIVGNRLRTAKIWVGDDLSQSAKDRWDGEDGGVAMLCDLNVAKGSMMISSYRDDGEPMYAMTPEGKRHVEKLLRRPA